MVKFFRIFSGIILIFLGLGIGYISMPMIAQGQLIVSGFGIALAALALATVAGGIAILRGASIKDILLMLHLSN